MRTLDQTELACSVCKETKPASDFGTRKSSRTGVVYYASLCRACDRAHNYEYRHKINEAGVKNQQAVQIRKLYGLTMQEYSSMMENQRSRCAICEAAFGSDITPHVDHCHSTGKVRGLLCGECNLLLGKAKDSVETLKKAVKYLEG